MAQSSQVASLSYGGTTIAAVGTASISLARPAMETTEIGSAVQSYIAGIYGGTASLDIFYDQNSTGHTALESAFTGGTSASLVLTVVTSQTLTANAYVTKFDINAQAGSVTRASIEFQLTGAITFA
jgi:hypothetical protein